jgi:rsbT co-antagonist protein RsbR
MSARPPPDPRGARIRDLILGLMDRGSRAPSPKVEWDLDAPPPSRRGRLVATGEPDSYSSWGVHGPSPRLAPEGDALDQALAGLETLSQEVTVMRATFAEANRRLSELMEVIIALVSLDYEKKAYVGDKNDVFDGLAAGLNMLGEELSATTVSKAHVNNIIESMSDLLVVTDREARIRTVNQAASNLLGYPKEELISQHIEALFSGLSAIDLIESGGVRDHERACKRKDGNEVCVSFSASVLRGTRGEAQGLVCVARDLTESRRLDEERWRLREAVQRQSIILEELSTPLIPITTEILVMPLIGTVDERRAAQMVDTLLHGVVTQRTKVAIIDITGIRTLEDQAVEGILKAVQAVRLVGAEVVLTGVRPEVAQRLVAQGYDLHKIKAFGSLQSGIVSAMKRVERAAGR